MLLLICRNPVVIWLVLWSLFEVYSIFIIISYCTIQVFPLTWLLSTAQEARYTPQERRRSRVPTSLRMFKIDGSYNRRSVIVLALFGSHHSRLSAAQRRDMVHGIGQWGFVFSGIETVSFLPTIVYKLYDAR